MSLQTDITVFRVHQTVPEVKKLSTKSGSQTTLFRNLSEWPSIRHYSSRILAFSSSRDNLQPRLQRSEFRRDYFEPLELDEEQSEADKENPDSPPPEFPENFPPWYSKSSLLKRDTSTVSRSLTIAKQIVSNASGRILGVANDLWVDMEEKCVNAVSVRQGMLLGPQKLMLLDSINQIGDVLLVDSDEALNQRISISGCSSIIGSDIVTRDGQFFGKIRDFTFQPANGKINSLIVDEFGLSFIPTTVLSTFEISADEILYCLPDQIGVRDDAYKRWKQVSRGIVETVMFEGMNFLRRQSNGSRFRDDRQQTSRDSENVWQDSVSKVRSYFSDDSSQQRGRRRATKATNVSRETYQTTQRPNAPVKLSNRSKRMVDPRIPRSRSNFKSEENVKANVVSRSLESPYQTNGKFNKSKQIIKDGRFSLGADDLLDG